MPEVIMCGLFAAVSQCPNVPPLHPAGVVELPGNFRKLVRAASEKELGMVPDGLSRTLELDRLERVAVTGIIRSSNTSREPRGSAPGAA